jgi:cytochrome c oxidase cbb3-type subunit III
MTTSERPGDASAEPRPSQRPKDELLDHEYDGIREYDNPLPRWWVWTFTGSIVFSIGYFFHYHISGNGTSIAEAYAAEMAEARQAAAKQAAAQPVTEQGLEKFMQDEAMMGDARAIFEQRCKICHGDHAQGLIGPNLTDGYWIHGKGTLLDIYNVINQGVPEKGMPPWGLQLSPTQVRMMAAFVGTLRGKNLPGKAPEGNPVTPPP